MAYILELFIKRYAAVAYMKESQEHSYSTNFRQDILFVQYEVLWPAYFQTTVQPATRFFHLALPIYHVPPEENSLKKSQIRIQTRKISKI